MVLRIVGQVGNLPPICHGRQVTNLPYKNKQTVAARNEAII
jgi:hypothetical protein